MSMIGSSNGLAWSAGRFLADDEQCVRQTATIAADHDAVITRADGTKYVPAGAIVPANDGTAVGILYEDVDVTNGAALGSIVVKGTVYADMLPEEPSDDSTAEGVTTPGAATALSGITFVEYPTITRPW
jgi:hypothetical protein